MRPVVLGLLTAVRFVFDVLGYAVAIGFVALLAFEFIHAPKLSESSVMLRVGHYLNPMVRMLSNWFGWTWPRGESTNWAPAILAVATMLVKSIVDGLLARVDFTARRLLKQKLHRHFDVPEDSGAQEKRRYKLSAESEEERAVLLKRYREIEDALKGAEQKTCAFLSLDVVGSTAM